MSTKVITYIRYKLIFNLKIWTEKQKINTFSLLETFIWQRRTFTYFRSILKGYQNSKCIINIHRMGRKGNLFKLYSSWMENFLSFFSPNEQIKNTFWILVACIYVPVRRTCCWTMLDFFHPISYLRSILNTSYLTDSYISFTLKLESG